MYTFKPIDNSRAGALYLDTLSFSLTFFLIYCFSHCGWVSLVSHGCEPNYTELYSVKDPGWGHTCSISWSVLQYEEIFHKVLPSKLIFPHQFCDDLYASL